MNDVELLGQALLQVEKARFLFEGDKKYGETVELVDNTDKYTLLLITFSILGTRQTIVSTPSTSEVTVCMSNTPKIEAVKNVETTRATLKRVNSSAYVIDFIKTIRENDVLMNDKVTSFSVISIVGIS